MYRGRSAASRGFFLSHSRYASCFASFSLSSSEAARRRPARGLQSQASAEARAKRRAQAVSCGASLRPSLRLPRRLKARGSRLEADVHLRAARRADGAPQSDLSRR
jgi:hypothetical protein